MEEQAQHLIDATTAAYKAGKINANPFTNGVPNVATMYPPAPLPVVPPPVVVNPLAGVRPQVMPMRPIMPPPISMMPLNIVRPPQQLRR